MLGKEEWNTKRKSDEEFNLEQLDNIFWKKNSPIRGVNGNWPQQTQDLPEKL